MSWSGQGPGGRRGYHHGNLREALIQAALDLIAKKGPAGFTFADAARSAGVSAAAPYRHFRDRDALVADVARRGFELFATHLDRAWNDGRPDPFAAFGLSLDHDPRLREIAERSFAVLRTASEALCARLPAEKRPPALMMSLHIWALSHGVASLFARGDSGRRRLPMTPEDLLEAGVLVYLRGLGLFAPAAEPER
jgi:AcrR family transcriptional regulator